MPVLDQPDDGRWGLRGNRLVDLRSTRSEQTVSLDEALVKGIADDGGLYVPVALPEFDLGDFDDARSITDVARILLQPYFESSQLAHDLNRFYFFQAAV